ncbi:MAG: hypothetical protein HGB08_02740 [Candidatus Moranbacteria bacterium]|nr:hypothetical protein [Candidatus Moranbacteria bacterium]
MRRISQAISALLIFILTVLPVSPEGLLSVFNRTNQARACYDDRMEIDHDTVWSGEVDISNTDVEIIEGATLTIEKGTRIRMGNIYVFDGRIDARGTSKENIVFVKPPFDPSSIPEEDQQYDPKCFMYEGGMIEFSDTPEENEDPSILEHVSFEDMGTYVEYDTSDCPPRIGINDKARRNIFNTAYASQELRFNPAVTFYSGRVDIDNSTFKDNSYADIEVDYYHSSEEESLDSSLMVSNSNFEGNLQGTALISFSGKDTEHGFVRDKEAIRLENNWYGDASGPSGAGLSGSGEEISGDYTLDGWSDHRFESVCADCASNVLFLPGIEGSSLYKNDLLGSEDQLWPPTPFSNDMDQLLFKDGKSMEDVYTKDVIDQISFLKTTQKFYKSFIDDLESKKSAEIISGYEAFPYDWRQSVEDVVENGTPHPGGERKFPVATVDELASSSKNGKVTIVAHSNGGLLAKAIMMKLEEEGKAGEVDKVVFVGTPQMGTPKAILSMLYGYKEGLLDGFLTSDYEAMKLAITIPGAYGLLPSKEYLDKSHDPLVTFSSGRFKSDYGEGIEGYDEFKKFLTGEGDEREDSVMNDASTPAVLNGNILEEARKMHEKEDAWKPPSGTKAIQIAGWGLDTIKGVRYGEKEKTRCHAVPGSKVPSCTGTGEYDNIFDPVLTVDGDGIVTSPSALMMPEGDDVERYWFDLYRSNKDDNDSKNHAYLFETDSIRQFLSKIISNKGENASLPEYIHKSLPKDYEGAKSRIRMSLYSPLNIHLYDDQGNHTGPKTVTVDGQETTIIEEGIPNSYYIELDERKYVGFPSGENIKLEMDGYDSGSYTLKAEEVQPSSSGNDEILAAAVFSDLPVSPDTKVNLDIPSSGVSGITKLIADYDGDGAEDYSAEPDSDSGQKKTDFSVSDESDSGNDDSDDEESISRTSIIKRISVVGKENVSTLTPQGINGGKIEGDAAESAPNGVQVDCADKAKAPCNCRMESSERMIKTIILLVMSIYSFLIVQVAIVVYYKKSKR